MEKILDSVRRIVGGDCVSDYFNPELILHTNTVIAIIDQLGVRVTTRTITEDTTWVELIPNIELIEDIKTFVTYKVKKIFDPPTGSSAMSALDEVLAECEYRIVLAVEGENEVKNSK